MWRAAAGRSVGEVDALVEEDTGPLHPERKEIARYLLSRGLDPDDLTPEPTRLDALARAAPVAAIPFQ